MHRLHTTLRAAFPAAVLALAGCAGFNEIDAGGSTGPGPDTSQAVLPSEATFRGSVQPWLEAQQCAAAGTCHATPGGGGGYVLVTDAPADGQILSNYEQSVCEERLQIYGTTPSGQFLSYFCAGPGNATAGHSAKTATNAECQALYDWVAEGSGQAGPCP